jgi:hypothetical protein
MPTEQTIAAAMQLGRDNAGRILEGRSVARARRARAIAGNRRSLSLRVNLVTPRASLDLEAAAAPGAGAPVSETVATLQTAGFLVAAGDSWFAYPFHDVLKDLEDNYGYNVESTAHAGDPIEKMAYHLGQLDDFPRQLDKVKDLGAVPRAALLSGGGDDIAGAEFGMLLNNFFSPIAGWDMDVVDGVLNDRIFTAFIAMLSGMDTLIKDRFGKSLPILVHGYDYPVPDGRGYLGAFGHFLFGPWLEPGFREKNFTDLAKRVQMMHEVIDRFNVVVQSLTKRFPFMHYIDVRNTLSTDPNQYKAWWDNELHPTEAGFEKVTDKFAAVLQTLP